jgi:hypothetical protein
VVVPAARRSLPALTADDVDALVPSVASMLAAGSSGAGVVAVRGRVALGRDLSEAVFGVLP